MTLSELYAKRTEVAGEIDALLKADSLTAEERTKCDELETEFDELSAKILAAEQEQKADAERRERAKARGAFLDKSRGRRTTLETGSRTEARVVKESFEDDPCRGFKSPREFCMAVMDHGRYSQHPNFRMDKRLEGLQATAGSDEAGDYSDPSGNFLVPEGFAPDLLKIKPEDDPMGPYVQRLPMSNPIVKIPARTDKNHTTSVSGGLIVTRRPETVAGTSALTKFEQVTMEAFSLFGLSYATEELLTDSPISFAALLAAGFSEQFAYQLIQERLRGTGVGEFLGVLNSPCLVTVAKEANQPAAAIVYENILHMRAQCWGYSNAIWIANHDSVPALMLMNQAVGTGGLPVWQPSAREDHPDMLLGRPLFFSEYTSTTGTVGDIILGNWSQYLEGTYQKLDSAESIHVRFVNHERAFKFWLRNAGQPWWRVPLTPNQSSQQLSPFVVCATRS